MKFLLFIALGILLCGGVAEGWEPEEYLVYIDTAEGNRLAIGPDTFLHSVRVKKVGTKQLWLVVVRNGDKKFKQKALDYIEAHPELDIQYWKSWVEMYQDTVGVGRTALEYVLKICWDFDSDPETPDSCKSVKDTLALGFTWQQIIDHKDRILYPIQLSKEME